MQRCNPDVPANSATLPIRFATELLAQLGSRGARSGLVADCFARCDISPALLGRPSARVTVEQFAQLYRQLAGALDDETPGFFSRPLRSGTLKFLCLAMLDAPSLRVALYRFCWFFRLLLDDIRFEMEELEAGGLRIAVAEHADLGPQRELVLELMLLLLQGIASWLIDRKILFAGIDLAYPPPPHAVEYRDLYTAPARFGQARCALYLDAATLAAPIRQNKRALSHFLARAPADWLHVSVGERLVTHRVRELLEESLGMARGIDAVAAALHMSARTLARRLDAEGTSFQAVKDALRRDAAIARIVRSDEPIASIGASLGFDDPSVFNRAFRRWTGSTPGSYRKAPTEG